MIVLNRIPIVSRFSILYCLGIAIVDWMQEYKDALETIILHDLFRGNNMVDCLNPRGRNKFKVTVDMVPQEMEGGTLIEECGGQSDKLKWERS